MAKNRKAQAKPLHTRQAQLARRLRDEKAARDKAKADLEEAKKNHETYMDKQQKVIADSDAKIIKMEEETKELYRAALGNGAPTEQGIIDSVIATLNDQIPTDMRILPEGEQHFEQLRGVLGAILTDLGKAKKEAERVAAEAQAAAERWTANAASRNAEDPVEMVLDEEEVQDLIAPMVGKRNEATESEEQYKERFQRVRKQFEQATAKVINKSFKKHKTEAPATAQKQ